MNRDGTDPAHIVAGVAIAAGIALYLFSKPTARGDHWSPETRMAAGAIGGGLLLYGMNSSGKISNVASAVGAGMLLRSIKDDPIRHLREIVSPAKLLA